MAELKARIIDVEAGLNVALLNEKFAEQMDFDVADRAKLSFRGKTLVALVDYSKSLVKAGEVGLFAEAAAALRVRNGQSVEIDLAPRPSSLDYIHKKLDGGTLAENEVRAIIDDLMAERLSSAESAAFISGVYTEGLNTDETVFLTKAILATGGIIKPKKRGVVVSEHSIGGVAGDRSSMLVVPIIASLGLTIPKTATRAISSACGSADAMEIFAPVDLNISQAERVINKAGGCLIWGGAVNIAAADDKLIKIRNPLRLDPKPLLLASILAKKKAEGARYVVLDIPIGRGAKVATMEEAHELANDFEALGKHLDMEIACVITDGSEPAMNCVGPALEARSVLEILGGETSSPLVEKACIMSGVLLSAVKDVTRQEGYRIAKQQIASGKALEKFREIIEAQGGNRGVRPSDVELADNSQKVFARESGVVAHVDNKTLSRIARILGAPSDKQAGIEILVSKGARVRAKQHIATLYSHSEEKIGFALEQLRKTPIIEIEKLVFDVV
jgi:AMP phosphorylase